jgi:sec-independent protein translocase protein TatA
MLNSPVDIAIVAGIALLVFGPKRLPELGKALGLGIGNFKKSLNAAQDEVTSAIDDSSKKEDELHPSKERETSTP